MKTVGMSLRANRWLLVMLFGALIPNFALASKAKVSPLAKQACESQVSATFKKKAVEVSMASLMGDLSEIEATSARESLQRRLESEKASCLHMARAAASTGAL
jgi:hypothetical protein